MLELPEAVTIARQIHENIIGKSIVKVEAARSPNKFAWYNGDPDDYQKMLIGRTINKANAYGGMVEVKAEDATMLFCDGVGLRFHNNQESIPKKHQLLIQFTDGTALSASVQMYGGLWCSLNGKFDNLYYAIAQQKPSPLSGKFNEEYFEQIINLSTVQKVSAKAFLATEQRFPGLGNGALQDILWNARIHPKTKINSLSREQKNQLFIKVKTVLAKMVKQGGRDTEKDLFGSPGGYQTVMSKNTAGQSCPECGTLIQKDNYLGGSVYYCANCQVI
ncbi:MAG: DNA-formamidopyrimidine glycosylase family protein [Chitinophagales bacterium]